MNRDYKIKKYLVLISLLFLGFIIAACDFSNKDDKPNVEVEVKLDKSALTMIKYEVAEFSATIEKGQPSDTVTWSVDNEDVISIAEEGNKVQIYAKGAGTATLRATFDEYFAEANILVMDDGVVPTIHYDFDELDLLVDHDFTLQFKISFDGSLFDDAVFTYTVEDEDIAVVEDGILKALSKGETTLTVTANWRQVSEEYLRITIPVNVKTDAALYFSTEKVELYTAEIENYKQSTNVPIVAMFNGEALTGVEITFDIEDDTVVKIVKEDDVYVIRALKEGSTKVMASLTYEGELFQTDYLVIDVKFPILDLTSEDAIELSLLDTTIADLKAHYDLDEITSVYDITGTRVELNIVEDLLEASNTYHGLKTLEIHTASHGLKVHANVYTKIIKTVDDFNEMLATAKVEDQVYNGYFILGNDIDFEGANYAPTDIGANWFDGGAFGFIGTFDGRGYAIKNMTVTGRGIFSGIGAGAVVKNLALLNTSLNANLEFGLFGGSGSESGTFENLYIEISSSAPNKQGFLVVGYGVSIRNVIMHIHNSVVLSSAIANDYYGAEVQYIHEVYIVSENATTLSNTEGKNYTNVSLYNSVGALMQANHDWDALGFDNHWQFVLNSDFSTEITLNAGQSINLYEHFNTKFIDVDTDALPAGVTFSNGILSTTENADAFNGVIELQHKLPGGELHSIELTVVEIIKLGHFELDEATDDNIELPGIDGTVEQLKINLTDIEFTVEDGKIVLNASDLSLLPNDEVLNGLVVTSLHTYTFTLEIQRESFIDLVRNVTLDSFELDSGSNTTWQIDATLMNGTSEIVSEFTYESLNDAIVSVSNTGLVTALKSGTASVKVTSTESPEISAVVNVTVELTEDDQTEGARIDTQINGSLADLAVQIGLPTGDQVVSITDVTDEQNHILATLSENKISGLDLGQKVWKINGEKLSIKVNVLVVTKILKTTTDVNEMLALAKIADQVYGGHFILGNDIDFDGANYAPTDVGANWFDGGALGFIGTFDGRGYAIKNMTVTARGIFSGLGDGAVVKNTSFVSTRFHDNLEFAMFGGSGSSNARLENLFIEITSSPLNKPGLLIVGYGIKINNLIIHTHADVQLGSNVVNDYYGSQESLINEVYIIAENAVTLANTQGKNYTNAYLYASETELEEEAIDWTEKGFGTYWKFDSDIPYLSSE